MKFNTRELTFAGVIAAAYAALTLLLAPISFGTVQFRLSEALCILPLFSPTAVWGLFVGCLLSNLLGGAGLPDIVFGSLATLCAALCTAKIGRKTQLVPPPLPLAALGCAMPVLFNAPIVGAVLAYAYTPETFFSGFLLFAAQVGIGEAGVLFLVGLPLTRVAGKVLARFRL